MGEGEVEREGWGLLLARLASEQQRMEATPAELLLDQAMRTMLPQASKMLDRRKQVGPGCASRPETGPDLLQILPAAAVKLGGQHTKVAHKRCHLYGWCLACTSAWQCLTCSCGELHSLPLCNSSLLPAGDTSSAAASFHPPRRSPRRLQHGGRPGRG